MNVLALCQRGVEQTLHREHLRGPPPTYPPTFSILHYKNVELAPPRRAETWTYLLCTCVQTVNINIGSASG